MPRRNPSVRLAVCTALLAGSLAIPIVTLTLPQLPLPILRGSSAPGPRTLSQVLIPAAAIGISSAVAVGPAPPAPPARFDWRRAAAVVYAMVTAGLLLRLVTGLVGCRRLYRQSTPACEGARESAGIASPVTVGLFRPAVLLPPDWR